MNHSTHFHYQVMEHVVEFLSIGVDLLGNPYIKELSLWMSYLDNWIIDSLFYVSQYKVRLYIIAIRVNFIVLTASIIYAIVGFGIIDSDCTLI